MSDIDSVIARSRLGGGFSERRTFTLARERAIRKLRDFALADPHGYVLELIQAAVAGGATYVDVRTGRASFHLAYVGGTLGRAELGQLFDYLFTSKDRLDLRHLRNLALGLNALLAFRPREVVIESGDGTLAGTHRLVVRGDAIDLGLADAPLRGTFLRALGMHRTDGSQEVRLIEERCLAAPIPFLVNDEAVFGPTARRIPALLGYRRTQPVDEGDLYGVIGLSTARKTNSFRLLTHGVWIQSFVWDDYPQLAGVINFDRLRKTVDHSAVVQDEVLREMWERLRPYAVQLVEGRGAPSIHHVRVLGGERIAPGALRRWFETHPSAVVTSASVLGDEEKAIRIADVGRGLGCPVLVCPDATLDALLAVSGVESAIVVAEGTEDERRFFSEPPGPVVPEPWLAPPVVLNAVRVEEAAAGWLGTEAAPEAREAVVRAFGYRGSLRAVLYAPADPSPARAGLWVRFATQGRTVHELELPSHHPGQWLVIELPALSPGPLRALLQSPRAQERIERWIGESFLSGAAQASLQARVLAGLRRQGAQLGRGARLMVLTALRQHALLRLRAHRPEGPGMGLSLSIDDEQAWLAELPIFRTLTGRALSIRALLASMEETHGLVYGVMEDVSADLEGLEGDRILALDAASEALLVELLGEGSYVRVDGRDLLASAEGVSCRDVAVGLRTYPDFPLLVEGRDPAGLEAAQRQRILDQLVRDLLARLSARGSSAGHRETRWHALRHLQWICLRHPEVARSAAGGRLWERGLFADPEGRSHTPATLWSALEAEKELPVRHYRRRSPPPELATTPGAPLGLMTTPYLLRLLPASARIRPAFDFDLGNVEAEANLATPQVAFHVQVPVAGEGVWGRIGVPLASQGRTILLVDAGGEVLGEVRRGGVGGWVRLEAAPAASEGEVEQALSRAVGELVATSIDRLTKLAPEALERTELERFLLDHALSKLELGADERGVPAASVSTGSALAILELPLFATPEGEAATGWQLVLMTGAGQDEHLDRWRVAWPEHQAAWLEALRQARHEARPRRPEVEVAPPPEEGGDPDGLAAQLGRWMERLRPDGLGAPTRIRMVPPWGRADELATVAERGAVLLVNRTHRLVLGTAALGQGFTALLLACYAELNAQQDLVTNLHESAFHLRVLEAIRSGALPTLGGRRS